MAFLPAGGVQADGVDEGFCDVAATPPILVELFTSQGCSSCPPADRLLTSLVEEGRAIALAYHVDYWNYIGWTDPFSSAKWSDRQREYAAAFGSNRIYTPQLVVNGQWEGVGSDPREVEAMLGRAAGAPCQDLSLTLEDRGDHLVARLGARLSGDADPTSLVARIAVAERGFSTPVGSGENAQRTLRNDNVVRVLETVGIAQAATGELEADALLDLDSNWKRQNVRVVAFLQDIETGSVVAVAQQNLPPAD